MTEPDGVDTAAHELVAHQRLVEMLMSVIDSLAPADGIIVAVEGRCAWCGQLNPDHRPLCSWHGAQQLLALAGRRRPTPDPRRSHD